MLVVPSKQATVGRMLPSKISLVVLLAFAYTSSHSATLGGAILSHGRGMSVADFRTWAAKEETSETRFFLDAGGYAVAMITTEKKKYFNETN